VIGFRLEAGATGPRAGTLTTPRGEVRTPVFMPVGTQATVKSLSPAEVRALGAGIILGNSYHLYLRPGVDRVAAAGGLHRFMGWKGPILTDSGGFQVFSLGGLRKLDDEGATFRSHLNGSEHRLTPESVMRVQEALGSDIVMAFDECPPAGASREEAFAATERTHRWAVRCLESHIGPAALFGICQGGMFADLRRESGSFIGSLGFPGCAIGGLSVGESKALTWPMLEASIADLPVDRPRYLMGVGSPEDLVEGVRRGVDMFDCVLPTRLARNGALFTPSGRVNITAARFAAQDDPLDAACDCMTCTEFSAAYLHHLFRCEELLGYRLASIHNLRFLVRHMEKMRAAITSGTFDSYADDFLHNYRPVDEAVREEQRRRWSAARAERPRGVPTTG
jgi:queuine tRNA-ribosyltransferase